MKRTILSVGILAALLPMGTIALQYANKEDVPEVHADLYTEQDGAWVLTGVEGGGKANIDRLTTSLTRERTDHKATKEKFSKLNGLDIDDLLLRNTEYDELKVRAEKVDDKAVEQIVELRVKQRLAPVERQLTEVKDKLGIFETENKTLKEKETNRSITSALRKAARAAKSPDAVIEDIEQIGARLFELDESGRVIAKDGVGVTPGIDPSMWLSDMKDKKPHWFGVNVGGGGNGNSGNQGGGSNPFSADNWNLTEQGRLFKANPDKAKKLASMAGVDINNPKRPVKK